MNNKYEEVIKRLDNMQKDIDTIVKYLDLEKEKKLREITENALKEFQEYCERVGVTVHIEEID